MSLQVSRCKRRAESLVNYGVYDRAEALEPSVDSVTIRVQKVNDAIYHLASTCLFLSEVVISRVQTSQVTYYY